MNIEPILIAELLVLGCVAGYLAGLLGIGGGMLLVPALVMIGSQSGFAPDYVVKSAVATSLGTIMFTSISSLRAHHGRGVVLWPVVRMLAPGIVVGSLIGAQIAKLLPARGLAALFAIFVAYSATQMFIDRKPKPSRQLPEGLGMLGAGSGIGGLSSLVGAGGGFVSVPFMVWCNVPIHNAVGTSAALGFPIALAGSIGYAWAGMSLPSTPTGSLGFLYLPALVLIASTSVLFAPMGASAAHRMNVKQLKRAFAVLLYGLATYMGWKALGG
jgi:uncharacterized protein